MAARVALARPSPGWLSAAPAPEFAAAGAPVFEGAPAFLARLADARPFADDGDLFERALAIARALPEAERIELINAHPRIGAVPGSVSASSFAEQGSDRGPDDDEARRVQADLNRLNEAYEKQFGFRFVIFVAGRPRSAIVPRIEERLHGQRQVEMETAVRDVVAIAWDRWRKAG